MTPNGRDGDGNRSEERAVRQALDRILQSPRLQQSRMLSQFLRFVVDESLAGRGDTLRQYQIAIGALRRDESFDPGTDPIVRVEARRLRGVLANYYENEGKNDPLRIDLPKGRYAPVFRPNTPGRPKAAARTKSVGRPAQGVEGPTLALLAFAPVGDDAGLVDIARGLSEELASAFSRFKVIRLVGPITSQDLAGEGPVNELVGRRYGAHYLVQGAVERHRGRLIVMPRLLSCETQRTIWSDRFGSDRESEGDPSRHWAIRRMVAEIVDFHGAVFSHWTQKALRRGARIPKKHEALVRYRGWLATLDRESHAAAVSACLEALARWPTDPLANALTADVLVAEHMIGVELEDESLEHAEHAARRAVALAPKQAFSRFVLGKVFLVQGERTPAVAEFDEALSLNPYTAFLRVRIGLFLCLAGDWHRGVELVEESCALAPDNSVARLALALVRYREGAFEAAWTEAFRINHPDLFWAPLLRAAILGQLGRSEVATGELDKLLHLFPDFAEQGRQHMRLFLSSDENVDMLMDGLRKAGLSIPQ